MSQYFRQARTLLSAFRQFPMVNLAAFVFPRTDREFLLNLPRQDIEIDESEEAVEPDMDAPIHASYEMELIKAVENRFTGTTQLGMYAHDGRFLMNAAFSLECHDDDPNLFWTIAGYSGRGLADTMLLSHPDELLLIDAGEYEFLWAAAILNIGSLASWKNSSITIFDDPTGRFRRIGCENALQATDDALSCLLNLTVPANQQPAIIEHQDSGGKSFRQLPDNVDVRDLCALLEKNRGRKSLIQVARELTKEVAGRDSRAHSLLRQARRFRHLWDRADS